MAKIHVDALRDLRDSLVEDRRRLVDTGFLTLETRHEAAGEFMGIQQLIDSIERAMEHETYLDRADGPPPPKRRLS